MPDCSVCTCMLVCVFFAHLCTHETAGAACTRHSLLPPFGRGRLKQASGAPRREKVKSCSVAIVREGGRCRIPDTARIETLDRGVLDALLSRGATATTCRES